MLAKRRVSLHSNDGGGTRVFNEGEEIPSEWAWNYRRDSEGNDAPAADLVAPTVPETATTIAQVLAWVEGAEGEETPESRAQAAYDAEQLREAPRKGVLEGLAPLLT